LAQAASLYLQSHLADLLMVDLLNQDSFKVDLDLVVLLAEHKLFRLAVL